MKLTILGSGTCVPTRENVSSGYALQIDDQLIIFDFGTGVLHRLVQAGLDYRLINHIFFTHLHLDHINDLAPLIFALKHTPGYEHNRTLNLWGPKGFIQYSTDLLQCHQFHASDWLEIEELDQGIKRFNHWTLDIKTVCHGKRPSLGYRVETASGVFAYTGDTEYCAELIQLLYHADIALVECSFPDAKQMPSHLTPGLALRAAQTADCKNVFLTHRYPVFSAGDLMIKGRSDYAGKVFLAQDLMRIQLIDKNIHFLEK